MRSEAVLLRAAAVARHHGADPGSMKVKRHVALADWLTSVVREHGECCFWPLEVDRFHREVIHALAVARTYIGEDA